MTKDVLRLAGLLAAIALATSRLGLLVHELLGHGGVAMAAGGTITEVRLFWFAGGWIRYRLPGDSYAAHMAAWMGGIAIEIVIGLCLALVVRGESLGRRVLRGVGLGLILHATWYLAVGTFHGMGDGLPLYRELGAARVPVAIAAGVAACLAMYLGARASVGPLARTLPGSTRRRAAGFAIAALLGGGLHAALTIGELRVRSDRTYSKVMQSERDRRIAVELAQWEREQAAQGVAPSVEQQRVERVRIADKHPTFPFVVLLAIATALAAVAGIRRTRGGPHEPLDNRLLVRASLIALVSNIAVIVLGWLLPG